MRSTQSGSINVVPHNGTLCRMEENYETVYKIAICSCEDASHHVLAFARNELIFMQRLFSILDTESRGLVGRDKVREFTTQRCPVFWRRDDDLRKLRPRKQDFYSIDDSPTFDEIWDAVVACSQIVVDCNPLHCELGLEAWMVFCRFIALAQYLEAKRRFSARHLQQTMTNSRNAPRGSEVVMIDVPPPEPPLSLTLEQMKAYEQRNHSPLPLPELDLDHSLLAVHDSVRRAGSDQSNGRVKIDLFGYSQHPGFNLEFAVTFTRPKKRNTIDVDQTVVCRSMVDMKWLDDTVTSHKALGGTLCGRILPPFPTTGNRTILPTFRTDDSLLNSSLKNTSGAIAVAAAGVGKIRNVAKSFFGSYFDFGNSKPSSRSSGPTGQNSPSLKMAARQLTGSKVVPESYYNPNSHDAQARKLERYLNYLLDHPALSTSFPLNAILTVRLSNVQLIALFTISHRFKTVQASQSGVEAAKKSLEECSKASKELKDQTPHLDDGGEPSAPLWSASGSNESSHPPNLTWVRTAAQAAMALRVHGMLETTGMPSASARLQHASLPSFGKTKHGSTWEDDSGGEQIENTPNDDNISTASTGQGFEEGVVQIQSELNSEVNIDPMDDSYDLLPLPVPAPERRILTVGNTNNPASTNVDSRFHYGSMADLDYIPFESHDDESKSVVLGNMLVDDNIDKLREVIGSVDTTITRCLSSSGAIGKTRQERLKVQLDVMRGLDSWEGFRGQFVSQRALLRGISGMSQSRDIYEESDFILVDGKNVVCLFTTNDRIH